MDGFHSYKPEARANTSPHFEPHSCLIEFIAALQFMSFNPFADQGGNPASIRVWRYTKLDGRYSTYLRFSLFSQYNTENYTNHILLLGSIPFEGFQDHRLVEIAVLAPSYMASCWMQQSASVNTQSKNYTKY